MACEDQPLLPSPVARGSLGTVWAEGVCCGDGAWRAGPWRVAGLLPRPGASRARAEAGSVACRCEAAFELPLLPACSSSPFWNGLQAVWVENVLKGTGKVRVRAC